ncbi:OLC1v1033260C1 [Oldenlandia corymbosa var. corymbosa]|uniref:RING-type E3 ubiquitin transferase n=1 Tax=Oldenlandia corymbosa var. corymbosa TaxID=529605 RepID=A0AAV1CNP4_OLDCO|nr:OLC1v1033260C1 [Oldenlandia corymbosa var. corymbosa]
MSNAGVTVAGGGPQLYFCHQCDRTVTINVSPTSDLVCPTCQSGFVEEFENPRSPEPTFSPDMLFSHGDPFSQIFELFASRSFRPIDPLNPRSQAIPQRSGTGPSAASSFSSGPDDFNPANYLMNLLMSRRAHGVNFEFVVEGQPGGSFSNIPNIGDYFLGPGFEQLIQQLSENDPNRYGTPPAAKSAVEGLPDVKVDEAMMKSELAQCAVCKDDFELGVEVKQMPCKHAYHKDCIIPWLELHNSCPVCRYELPTDDPDYENRDRGNSGDSSGSEPTRPNGRQFTISLPWGLGGFGSTSRGGGSN